MRQVNCSDRIFSGPIFAVDRDRLIESNGLEVTRDVIRHPGGAGALPIFADGRVALVRQYRHPARAELLEIPAGRLEAGETPELCASREVEQETGFRPGRVERLSSFYTTPGFCEEVLHIFLATDLTPTRQQLDHDELVEVQFFPLAEVLQMVHRGEIVDSKTIIALLLASANGTPSGAS
ncbi:MAG: NUDIX hydrolase [Acidobacteria bacterium]|nr:NUDIX hydrolase [Acidobacteriota bacterium]